MTDYFDQPLELGDPVVAIHDNVSSTRFLELFVVVGFTKERVELHPVSEYTYTKYKYSNKFEDNIIRREFVLKKPEGIIKI